MRTAFVLGAGLGTRLLPLTANRPKPLVPLVNKPLVSYGLDLLLASGFERFVINTHHCASAWKNCFGGDGFESEYLGHPIHFRHEPVLLETGGGLKNIEDLACGEDLLVFNGDVLADFPLTDLVRLHRESGNVATLVLRSSGGPKHIHFDPVSSLVRDIRSSLGNQSAPSCVFTGIYMVSPEIFPWLPPRTAESIIQVFLKMIQAGKRIGAKVIDEGVWMDLGSRQSYLDAHRHVLAKPLSYPLGCPLQAIAPGVDLPSDLEMQGAVVIGRGAKLGEGVRLVDTVIWENAEIASRSDLVRCIVRDGQRASGNGEDFDF